LGCEESYNSDGDFWVARRVTIQIVIFGLQGELQFIWRFLGCKDSYNSDGDFWVARSVTIQMVIFGLQGELQFRW